MKTGLIIAVDGPAGAGKSSASRLLAESLGYRYVDTGALYRAVGLLALEHGVSAEDPTGLAALCDGLVLRFVPGPEGLRLLLGERDLTAAIRRPEVSQMASKVSAQPAVRQRLLALQRELGQRRWGGGGRPRYRNRGFPDADVKFYLDARLRNGTPAARRVASNREAASLTATIQEMRSGTGGTAGGRMRLCDGLRRGVVDTTVLTPTEVVDTMVRYIHAARKC